MNRSIRIIVFLLILIISTLMHLPHFSKDLMSIHVWRQTQTQTTINNFYEEDMNIFHPKRNDRGDGDGIFRMEFPLMQWMVAGVYKGLGNHIIITRLFMFILGLISVIGIYQLLFSLFRNPVLAILGAWAFNFSPAFYFYTINPLPDNLALCCSVWGLALFFLWHGSRRIVYLLMSGFLLSAGALCKLPFILFYIVPIVYFTREIINRKESFLKITGPALSALGFGILPVAWYAWVIPQWGRNRIIMGMLDNRISFTQSLDYLQFNLISTLPELLLNYGSLIFFLAGFFFLYRRGAYRDPRFQLILALGIGLLFYFFFELNAIAKIHDYYLFPFYPLLFMLVAYGAYHMLFSRLKLLKYLSILCLVILPLTCYLRMQSRWNPDSPGFNSDLLEHKTELRGAVPKDALVVAGNDESHHIFFYYIDKKGWGFDSEYLTEEMLDMMIRKGAKYLYSDSRAVDENESLKYCLDEMILERGSIRVYRLRNNIDTDD